MMHDDILTCGASNVEFEGDCSTREEGKSHDHGLKYKTLFCYLFIYLFFEEYKQLFRR